MGERPPSCLSRHSRQGRNPQGKSRAGPERPFALREIEACPEALEGGERGAAAPKCGAGRGRPTSNHDWPTRVPYSPPTHPTPTLPPPHCPHAAQPATLPACKPLSTAAFRTQPTSTAFMGAIEPSNRLPRIDDGAPFGSPTAGICFNTAERSWIRFVATMRHGSYESHHFSKIPQLRRPQIPQLRRPQKTIPQLAQFHTRSMAECGSPDLV